MRSNTRSGSKPTNTAHMDVNINASQKRTSIDLFIAYAYFIKLKVMGRCFEYHLILTKL